MAFVEWNESIQLGIKKFDDHHRKLISLINRLDDALDNAMEDPDQQTRLGEILRELHNYTLYHFRAEEEYMKSIHYADYENHLQMHRQFIAELETHINSYISGKKIAIALLAFLSEWLTDHISVADKKYAVFARIRGMYLPES